MCPEVGLAPGRNQGCSMFQFNADELLRWGNFRFPLSRRDCRFAQCAVAAPACCCETNISLLESAVKEM